MSDQWILIDAATHALVDDTIYDQQPNPSDGQEIRLVMPGYPADWYWSASLDGFVRKDKTPELMTVGRFKLLLTKEERIAIRSAAASNTDVEDFLDLLNGFTDGVSLSDPLLIGAVTQLATAGLLTSDRAVAIIAGQTP